MERLRIAVPTEAHGGLEDVVSEVFGRAKTFTIVDVENEEVKNVQVIDNPAASYEHGAGPVVVKTLSDLKVDSVISSELGPGASTLLKHCKISHFSAKPTAKVALVLKEALSKLADE